MGVDVFSISEAARGNLVEAAMVRQGSEAWEMSHAGREECLGSRNGVLWLREWGLGGLGNQRPGAETLDPSFCIVKPFCHLILHHAEVSFLVLMIIRVIHEQRLWLPL